MPEGDTVYVMIQELTRYGEPRTSTVWKPATGEGFDARDSRYPATFSSDQRELDSRIELCPTECKVFV